jgi:hypothetical protein
MAVLVPLRGSREWLGTEQMRRAGLTPGMMTATELGGPAAVVDSASKYATINWWTGSLAYPCMFWSALGQPEWVLERDEKTRKTAPRKPVD